MMKIERFIGGSLEANGYIIYHNDGGEAFIIDPGYNPGRFIDFVKAHDLKVKAILLTHHHYDHVGAVDRVKSALGVPVYIHRSDVDEYKQSVDVMLEDGDILTFDDEELKVLHTPGHTAGGVCFYSEKSKIVFTGDTIFNIDIGRTDFSDGSPWGMKDTMNDVINKWENDIVIYPGHGDSANMKFVRAHNTEFIEALD